LKAGAEKAVMVGAKETGVSGMFKSQTKFFTVLIALILLSSSGCAGCLQGEKHRIAPKQAAGWYPLQVTDSYQRQVTIPKAPRRIISLAPNITETLFVLGKGKLVAGRTDYCDYPAAARQVPSVGSLQSPNIEKIVQLQPDLVIASTHFQKGVLVKLEELQIKVVVLYGEESFAGVYDTIRQVGRIVNASRTAAQVIAKMRRKVNSVTAKVKGRPKPRVYYVVSFGKADNYTAGQNTFIAKMLALAGGVNVANDTKGWQYSLEKLVAQNPELVICSKYFNSKARLQQATGYRDLSAVKAGRLFAIDSNLLDRQGPRLADGLVALARIIHPEIFQGKGKE
jgi:iron complex transport system substrate-binding protein